MKRSAFKRVTLLLLMCFVLFTLVACGKQDSTVNSGSSAVSENKANDKLTREAYIGLVGQYFGYDNCEATSDYYSDVSANSPYYQCIQACAAWNVIDAGGSFEPTSNATMEFALSTAVRAIGLNELQITNANSDARDLADYYLDNIAKLDKDGYESDITEKVAVQILQYAVAYGNEVELPQVVDVEYNSAVKIAAQDIYVPASGNVGMLAEGHNYSVGDIIYFEETQTGYPRGVKITSIEGDSFKFTDATIEEVFDKLEISGTFDGNVVNAFSASENVSIYGEDAWFPSDVRKNRNDYFIDRLANGVRVDKGKDHVNFIASISDGKDKAEFRIGINNIKVTTAYRHGATVLSPEDVKLSVSFNTSIDASSELHYSRTIPLGSIDLSIWGPLFVKMSLSANIGADGEVKLNYSLHNTANVEWQKGVGINHGFTTSTEANAEGNVSLTAEVTAMANLMIKFVGEYSIVNGQITSGIVVIAKTETDLLGEYPDCTDVLGYVPLKWGINQKGCIITKINSSWTSKGAIWNAKNSAIRFHRHIENGSRTQDDLCTRGTEKEVVQEVIKVDGSVFDEYDLFQFEKITFDFIEMSKYVMFFEPGSESEIEFTSIPEGNTKDTLVYSVDDTSVCEVRNGKIVAKNPGNTLIHISTDDEMFSAAIAVIVNEDYSIEGFEAL